jgi:hypothetical protein
MTITATPPAVTGSSNLSNSLDVPYIAPSSCPAGGRQRREEVAEMLRWSQEISVLSTRLRRRSPEVITKPTSACSPQQQRLQQANTRCHHVATSESSSLTGFQPVRKPGYQVRKPRTDSYYGHEATSVMASRFVRLCVDWPSVISLTDGLCRTPHRSNPCSTAPTSRRPTVLHHARPSPASSPTHSITPASPTLSCSPASSC